MKTQSSYLQIGYQPNRHHDLVVTFRLEPAEGYSFEEVAQAIAGESSIGTWTFLGDLSPKVFTALAAKIFFLDKKTKIVKIAYPLGLFEEGSISQLLSSIGGNVFGMKAVKHLRLEDIEFPVKYIEAFEGPAFGMAGVRKTLKIFNRPIIGSIMKPKIGLTSEQNARLAYETFKNGVDFIKDDENLTDLNINPFEERVERVMALKKKLEKETGKKKIYAFNITAPAEEMLERARIVKENGGRCIMVDILTAGWSALQYLRRENPGMIIHGHRAGHAMFDRDPQHGMTMYIIAKLARLAGVDQLHTGTVVGKMTGGGEEILRIDNFLRAEWHGLKPVFPVASGGLHPSLVPPLMKALGPELVMNFGGGIHGHPQGSGAGARAVYAAVEATMNNISLEEAAKTHPALEEALNYWAS